MSDHDPYATYAYPLTEAEAEIARHHKDFKRVSDLVEAALHPKTAPIYESDAARAKRYREALIEIRGVVG